MKFLRRLTLLIVVSLAALAASSLLLEESYAGFGKDVFVDIPKGSSAVAMSRMLDDAGVVRSRWLFVLARALRPRAKLQAGEYLFSKPAWLRENIIQICAQSQLAVLVIKALAARQVAMRFGPRQVRSDAVVQAAASPLVVVLLASGVHVVNVDGVFVRRGQLLGPEFDHVQEAVAGL